MPDNHPGRIPGDFDLQPLHYHPRSPLQAWNAADELLLQYSIDSNVTMNPRRILVVNDSAGALAIAWQVHHPHSWLDSATARLALENNLGRNGLATDSVICLRADQTPVGIYDLVLMQLPKTLSLLDYQLCILRNHIGQHSQVLAAGMVKHMTPAQTERFQQIIGPCQVSRAQKKARLIQARLDPQRPSPQMPPSTTYPIPGSPLQLVNHAHVFSRERLDIGTRFLLQHFPDLSGARTILDLGCGNGALGIYAAWQQPQAKIHFVDDSALALLSARESVDLNHLPNPVHFHHDDSLTHFDGKVDSVLCNPPFHEGNRVHTDIARRMFRDAARHLNPGGTLYVVANRHLDYRPLLQRHFHNVQQLAANPKFVIVKAAM